jgi:hypothetical protein
MNYRTFWLAIGLGTMMFFAANSASAQLNIFRKSAPAAEDIPLKENHGPWLVMCASFIGDAGEAQALALIEELRNSYKLNAYLYRKEFDYSEKIIMAGWEAPVDMQGAPVPRTGVPAHTATFEEIAVVVGHFPSLDDDNAQRTLKLIKTLKPETLRIDEHTTSLQRMGALRAIQRNMSDYQEQREKGPMGSAFLMPNPLLPPDYFDRPVIDDVIMEANKSVKYSLLDCPGNYSVRVATFKGEQLLESGDAFGGSRLLESKRKFEEQARSGKPLTESKLAEADLKAVVLCTLLRKKGVEAWVFHDHHESYVCVGSFDWAKRTTAAGEETNSEIAEVVQQYKAREVVQNGHVQLRRRTIEALDGLDVYFDAQPLPIAVPKVAAKQKRSGIFGH